MNIRAFVILFSLVLFSCQKKEVFNPNSLLLTSTSNGQVSSVVTLGGSNNDVAKSVVATSDGGYIIAGHTHSIDGDVEGKTDSSFDFWLLKFNSENVLEWSQTYGGSKDDRARKIIQTSDGNFVVIGYSDSIDGDVSSNNGLRDFWIFKINPTGTLLWEKSYGFAGNDEGFNIQETPDGNLMAIGILDVTASGGQGNTGRSQQRHAGGDYWVLKLNTNGDLMWSRFFGGSFTDTAYDISMDSSGNSIIVGSSDSNDVDITSNKGGYDIWTIKIDENGSLLWEKSFGGTQIDQGSSINPMGNNFLIGGIALSDDRDVQSNNGGADAWYALIDENGFIIKSFNLGGSGFDFPNELLSTFDGNFVLTGNSRSSDGDTSGNNGQNDIWVVKFDANGSLLWKASVGGDNIDLGNQSAQLRDGSIVTVGESSSASGDVLENKGFADALIIRIR